MELIYVKLLINNLFYIIELFYLLSILQKYPLTRSSAKVKAKVF